MNKINNEIWCVVGNVKKEIPYGPGGKEIKSGLKKFKAGAKLHIIDAYYGRAEYIIAIGQHRKSGKYISCAVRANTVENFRVKKIWRWCIYSDELIIFNSSMLFMSVLISTNQVSS